MKMLLSFFLLLFFSVAAVNAEEADKKAQLMMEMKTMLDAMEEIQSGGLYSCGDCMKSGVKKTAEGFGRPGVGRCQRDSSQRPGVRL